MYLIKFRTQDRLSDRYVAASQFSLRARRMHSWLIYIVIAKSIRPCYNARNMLRRDEATNTSSTREKCFFGERIVWRKYLLVEFYRSFLTITKLRGHLWEKLGRLKIIILRMQLMLVILTKC